jgi:tRNA 2-selenouridine synthase
MLPNPKKSQSPASSSPPLSALPHPLDLEIQDLSAYPLIIDARSPREFENDHLPAAVNLPVVDNDQYAEVGTLHKTDKHRAYLIGVEYSLRNIAAALSQTVSKFSRSDRILVYCFRGGKRSRLWAENLRTIGYTVDVLPGGWKAYRRWVSSALEVLPRTFDYRVLCGPTGCGKTRLLSALRECGEQVLDLESIARHRGSLIGALPDENQPSQKLFDTMLLDILRGYDVDKIVWVEAESKKIGQLQIPLSMFEAMHASPFFRVTASMPERVKLWRQDYANLETDPDFLMARLQPLKSLVGATTLASWQLLADQRRMPELFEQLMLQHYDPIYLRTSTRHYPGFVDAPEITLKSLDHADLLPVARELASRMTQL